MIALSFLILFGGAELLVRGGAAMALKLGLSPLLIGLTVVAYGTSAPELVVSLKAAYAGQSDIAIGNVVGSNIFNIGMILGLAALICPIKSHLQVLKWDAPVLLLVTLLVPLSFLDGVVSRIEGGAMMLAAIAYTAWTVRISKASVNENIDHEEVGASTKDRSLFWHIGTIAVGLIVLILGSRLLVTNAILVAQSMGISEAIIGLTIVAAGTSMPELATSAVAAFRKHSDIALGNVLGSNLFNLLFVLGGSSVIHPIATTGMRMLDLAAMAGVTFLLVVFLISGKRLARWEGAALLACFGTYLFLMWPSA